MRCICCGSEMREGAFYCDVCGAPAPEGVNQQNVVNPAQQIYNMQQDQQSIQPSEANMEPPVFGKPFVERNQNQIENGYVGYRNQPMNTPSDGYPNDQKKSGKGLIIALCAIIGVLVVGISIVLILLLKNNKDPENSKTANAGTTEFRSTEIMTTETPVNSEKKTEDNAEAQSTERTESNTTENQTEDVVAVKEVPTRKEAKEAFDKLYEKAVSYYKEQNVAGFYKLFTSTTSNDEMDSSYDSLGQILDKDYPNENSEIIWDDGQYFMVFVQRSLTTSNNGKTNSAWNSKWWIITREDGKWKFDASEKAYIALDDEKTGVYQAVFPDGWLDARKNGRNSATFDTNDLSWVNHEMIIPGFFDARVYVAWQNEDGSLGVLINVKNGTDYIQNIKSITFTITDDELGTVIEKKTGGDTINPGKALNYTITIDASEVLTGTQQWGQLHSSVDLVY